MRRISVVGSSGSGKTTMARALAGILGYPHLELDGVFHQPDWTPLPEEDFRSVVEDYTAASVWIVDGNYTSLGVNELVWSRADAVVWMDMSRATVMRRVTLRSVRRSITGEELWNGNRERPANLVKWNPEENIIRWAWTTHGPNRSKYEQRLAEPRWAHLDIHRIRTPREANAFVQELRS